MSDKRQKGQAIILVLVALSLCLIAIIGLAIDASQLYAQRQMAQAAADAAAQAGMDSIFGSTNTAVTYNNGFGTADFDCGAGSTLTPCAYARMNGFDPANGDQVRVEFPASEPGITLTAKPFTAKVIKVTIFHPVKTSLMQYLGVASSTVAVQARAAIVDVPLTPPIIVTHPSLPASFFINGGPLLQVCGGPSLSIQVNSTDVGSIALNGSSNLVDLSKAGPNDDGFCNKGTGASFADKGGPNPYPNSVSNAAACPGSGLCLGTQGKYQQPAGPIPDPLADVPAPTDPGFIAPAPCNVTVPPSSACQSNKTYGCPTASCTLYFPGDYPAGITVKNDTALFAPGLYYITSTGFQTQANGNVQMAAGYPADAVWGMGNGALFYIVNDGTFNVGANGSVNLVGPPDSSVWKGIVFWESRTGPPNITKTGGHRLGGGGGFVLSGAIYLHNLASICSTTQYQRLILQGTPGQQTLIRGEIIVNVLELGGNAGIQMQIDPALVLLLSKVALVR